MGRLPRMAEQHAAHLVREAAPYEYPIHSDNLIYPVRFYGFKTLLYLNTGLTSISESKMNNQQQINIHSDAHQNYQVATAQKEKRLPSRNVDSVNTSPVATQTETAKGDVEGIHHRAREASKKTFFIAEPHESGSHRINYEEYAEQAPAFSTSWLPSVIPPIRAEIPADLPEWFEPRAVQKAMFTGLKQAYADGCVSPLIMAMTASGKTLFTARLYHLLLTQNPKQRLLFVVPRVSLVDQAVKEFESLNLNPSVIWLKDSRFDPAAQIHIASIDTMLSRLKSDNPHTKEFFQNFQFDYVAVDEAHLKREDLDLIKFKRRFGLSASPFTKGLGLVYDRLIKTMSTDQLIKDGTIKPYWPIAAARKIDQSKLVMSSTGEYTEESEKLAANELIGDFINDVQTDERMQGRKWIAFCRSIDSCTYFYEEFQKVGIPVGIIHSKMSASARRLTLEASERGEYEGLLSVVALREGYSDKTINMVVWLTSFAPAKWDKSRPNNLNGWVQGNGRGGRANDGDTDCIVFDYGDNWRRYGSPNIFIDSIEKLDARKDDEPHGSDVVDRKPKPKECSECHSLFEKGNICPGCGHELEDYTQMVEGKEMKFVKGKLIELDGKPPSKQPKDFSIGEKKLFWQGIKHEGFLLREKKKMKGQHWPNGKEFGWCMNKYKAFFGTEPPTSIRSAIPQPNKEASAFCERELNKWIQMQRRKGYAKRKAVAA